MASWWKQESDYDSKNKGHPWTSKSDKKPGFLGPLPQVGGLRQEILGVAGLA